MPGPPTSILRADLVGRRGLARHGAVCVRAALQAGCAAWGRVQFNMRPVFRFETSGGQVALGGVPRLQEFVQEVSAGAVLSVDPRVDIGAPSPVEVRAIGHRRIDLDDPAVFLALLEKNAVVNVTSVFDPRSIAHARCVRMDFFCGCSDLPVWRETGPSAVKAAPFLERSD